MKYTLEQIINTYALMIVLDSGVIWLYVNDGKSGLVSYVLREQESYFQLHYPKPSTYSAVYETLKCTGPIGYAERIYDYESFMRHFGLRFMKF